MEAIERCVAKLLIALSRCVSTIVTPSAAALTSGRPVACSRPSMIDCVIPPAQKPIVFASLLRVIAHAVSTASMIAVT